MFFFHFPPKPLVLLIFAEGWIFRCIDTMADSLTLPLRPIPEKRDRPDTLPVEIAQINNQWGSFREVNEEVLRNKIAEEEEKDGLDEVDESDQDASDLDSTERLEQLYKRRAEITQFAM